MDVSRRNNNGHRRTSFASFVAAPTLIGSLMAIFLVAIPMTRASENNERTQSSERSEELTVASRHDRTRSLTQENLRTAHHRAIVVIANIGHSQLPDLDPPAGHRLPNGLLAPLTC